jgi:uncharacterized phage-associated protein
LSELTPVAHTKDMGCDVIDCIHKHFKRRIRLGVACGGKNMFTKKQRMNVLDVSAYFIQKASDSGSTGERGKLSPLKLQKILYFAQGWYLGNTSKALFKEKIWAWKFGPVVKEVYDLYKGYGGGNLATMKLPCDSQPTQEDKDFLDQLWNQYGGESAEELVTATHNSDPWLDAFGNPYSKEITKAAMQRYFENLIA